MTTEVDNSELYIATLELVEDVFGVKVGGIDSVNTNVTDVFGLAESSLGSVSMNEGQLDVNLGFDELDIFARCFQVPIENKPDAYRLVSASMFAGYVIAYSATDRTKVFSEANEVFNQVLIDQSPIVGLLEDCAIRSFGSLEAPERTFSDIAKRDPSEIATINMHRIGSGFVLQAEQRLGESSKLELCEYINEVLNNSINKHIENAQIMFGAAGLRTPHRQASIAERVMERLMKQRGIGFAFPYSEIEIENLKYMIQVANNIPDNRETSERSEFAQDEETERWGELVDLSGGHLVVDPQYMRVDTTGD